MKETLTVQTLRPVHTHGEAAERALERGEASLEFYRSLLEYGTDEQIWEFEVMRGAAIRWDILKDRALRPAVPPTWLEIRLNGDRHK